MAPRPSDDVRAWLAGGPSLAELRAAYPEEWAAVERDLGRVLATGDLDALRAYAAAPSRRARRAGGPDGTAGEIRRQMATAALRRLTLSAATGVTDGKVRFNLVNGWIAQRLLFERGLVRKPVSLRWFRLLWPLLWQRRFLLPLVERKGIYCFYSRALVDALAQLVGDRDAVEIAAGDGTLSRFLADAGVRITATDDASWAAGAGAGEASGVERQEAREALRRRRPRVVVCSWPPPGNAFERHVFATPSVELYVVIASRHEFATGDWAAYRAQDAFAWAEEPALSRLVLPPELEPAVLVFRRGAATPSGAGRHHGSP